MPLELPCQVPPAATCVGTVRPSTGSLSSVFFTWVPGRASLMVGRRGRLHFLLGYLTLGREVVSKSPSLCPAFADRVPCLIRKSVEGNSTSGGEGGEA